MNKGKSDDHANIKKNMLEPMQMHMRFIVLFYRVNDCNDEPANKFFSNVNKNESNH